MFDKSIKKKNKFGIKICNIVKKNLNNHGFFTSDELPGYGISKGEKEFIFKITKAKENDLVVLFAYDKKESQRTKDFLDGVLKKHKE